MGEWIWPRCNGAHHFTPSSNATTTVPQSYDQLEFAPLPEIKLPDYERYQLPNGLVVYLIEDHKLPLVSGQAVIRVGRRWEPTDKVGLAQLTGTTMRTGGTQQHSAAELNRLLEIRAAAIEASIGTASGSASFSALSKDLPTVFSLFGEVLQTPAFEASQVELAATQIRGAIARRNDDPSAIVGRKFKQLLYGVESPYARLVEYDTLANIKREDIVNFHQRYIRPDQMILGIVGDFDASTMKKQIATIFGGWQVPGQVSPLTPPPATQINQSDIYLADLPYLNQSNVLVGQLGGKINSPDYPALSVMNGVLGGFSGRLFNNIRSKKGLAYQVSASWRAAYDYPGQFVGGGSTRTETTVPFIESLKQEFQKLRTAPVSVDELGNAKETILNSFVFNFQTPAQTLSRLMTYEYYGYPADFIFNYQRQVTATTIADVQRVAKKYLHPDKMFTVIVGNGTQIKPALAAVDTPVVPLDITIPDPS